MKCRHCQYEIADQVKFCPECGSQVYVERKDTPSNDTLKVATSSHKQWTPQSLDLVGCAGVIIMAMVFLFGTGVWWFNRRDARAIERELNVRGCLTAEPGDAEAQFKLFRKAAEQGAADAQNNLGKCYAKGEGIDKNEQEAIKWFRKAAEQEFAEAQNNLGKCYWNGIGVAENEHEAVKWFLKAAEQGFALGQCTLGWCYQYGVGIAKDEQEAVKWYRKAAEQGNALGQYSLGGCYEDGIGVAKDEQEAVKWYLKAAEQGNALGQYSLGGCYEDGGG